MIGVIHQPHFLPWLGYYNKLANAQIFIIQDNVQFRKDYFQNRTLIRNPRTNTLKWLTIPVKHNLVTPINKVIIDNNIYWKNKISSRLYHFYHKTPYFDNYYNDIIFIISNSNYLLSDLNINLLKYTLDKLEISIIIKTASHYEKQHSTTEDILHICKRENINSLIFGEGGGIKYHGINYFKSYGIKINEQHFKSNLNLDFYGNFPIINLSILDFLFHYDIEKVKYIVKNTWKI